MSCESAVTLLAAILVAAVFAIFGFPYRFYHCWYSWSHKGAIIGFLIYLFLAGGGGGFVGWLPAQLGHVAPSPSPWINGAIFGIGGSLVVRADFRTKYAKEPQEAQRAASALAKGIEWSTDLLDQVVRYKAKQWLTGLNDRELLVATRDLIYEIKAKPPGTTPRTAKAMVMTRAVEAMKIFTSGPDAEERADARARLTYFCLEYMVGEHIPKPPTLIPVSPAPAPAPADETIAD
jgi:hypothetical protein